MFRFVKAKEAREKFSEANDCSVIATSIAARVPYNEAHAALRAQGRPNRRGSTVSQLLRALESLGCSLEEIDNPRQPNGSRYTMKTVGRLARRGYYIVLVRRHVAAVVNGDVEDWSTDHKHRVLKVWKVTKKRG